MTEDKRRLILVVEDDPANARMLESVLEVGGYEAVSANNGEQACDMAREHLPDLILMDIKLPVLDGLEATRRIKSDPATRRIPIIAHTGFAMEGDREKMLAGGCDGYIPKPLLLQDFLHQVKEFLEGESTEMQDE